MLELHSEKLKLIHEKNNKEFMDKSKTASDRRKPRNHSSKKHVTYYN